MQQLEPGTGESVGQLIGVLVEPLADLRVDRVHLHTHVGGGHHRLELRFAGCSIGNGVGHRVADRLPLMCTRGALRQLPLVAQQRVEVAVVPLGGSRRPRTFDAARGRVGAFAGPIAVDPAHAHLLDGCAFRLGADEIGVTGAVGLAEGVTADGQRCGLLIVHCHSFERLTDVARRSQRVRVAVGALRVDVDQAHGARTERLVEFVVRVVPLDAHPFGLGAPVDVVLGGPDVDAAAAEAERLEAHRFECDVAGEQQEVRPGDGVAVLLLDRLEQCPSLVEVAVVRPRVERCEALVAGTAAATSVLGAVGAGRVPGHPNEHRAVVAEVRWPPFLAVGHQVRQVLLQRVVVEREERLRVVEVTERVRRRAVLMQHPQVERVGPPVLRCGHAFARVGDAVAAHDRAARLAVVDVERLGVVAHWYSLL